MATSWTEQLRYERLYPFYNLFLLLSVHNLYVLLYICFRNKKFSYYFQDSQELRNICLKLKRNNFKMNSVTRSFAEALTCPKNLVNIPWGVLRSAITALCIVNTDTAKQFLVNIHSSCNPTDCWTEWKNTVKLKLNIYTWNWNTNNYWMHFVWILMWKSAFRKI